MTWAKYGAEFSAECDEAGLSDSAYRTHREALDRLYLTEQPSCRIPKHVVRRLPGSNRTRAVAELEAAGFWKEHDGCWEVIHYAAVIRDSLIAQGNSRDRNRRSQQAYRNRRSGAGGG